MAGAWWVCGDLSRSVGWEGGWEFEGRVCFFLWVVGMVSEGGPMAFEGLECFGGCGMMVG